MCRTRNIPQGSNLELCSTTVFGRFQSPMMSDNDDLYIIQFQCIRVYFYNL